MASLGRVRPALFGFEPGCAWMLQGACSCARVAASRSCCAATATVATATAAGSAGAWRATPLGARALAGTSGLGAAGLPTPSGRGAGASVARDRGDAGGGLQQNVTHQGCPPGVAAAPLVAWTHHTTSAPEPACTATTSPIAATTTVTATATATTAITPGLCRRCARLQPAWVRQGFLRHGPRLGVHQARPGWRHDHSP